MAAKKRASKVEYSPAVQRLRLAVVCLAVLMVPVFALVAVYGFRYVDQEKDFGWKADREWVVRSVEAGGPADGVLAAGDRLIAVRGYQTRTLAPEMFTRDIPVGEPYVLDVERGSQKMSVALRAAAKPAKGNFPVFLLEWILALVTWGSALIVFYYKCTERVALRYFLVGLALTIFSLALAMVPSNGMASGWWLTLAMSMYAVSPLQMLALYWFLSIFPQQPVPSTRRIVLERVLTILTLIAWLPTAAFALLRTPGYEWSSNFYASWPRLTALIQAGFAAMTPLAGATCSAASIAIVYRNYSRLDTEDMKRRVRWLAWGAIVGFAPILLVLFTWLLGTIFHFGSQPVFIGWLKYANAFAVVGPIATTYAILKHRLMGFQLLLRIGVQYLLAKNTLRALLVLPALSLVYTIVRNPNLPVGDLLFKGSGPWNLILLMLTIVGVTYRQALTDFVERRFFRTAYNEEKVLLTHIERLPTLDSVEDISQLLSEDVTTYLQVSWVRVFFRQQRHSELVEVHSSRLSNAKSSLPQDGSFVRHMERQLSAEEWDQLVEDCPEAESFWTDRFGDEAPAIVVPVLGGERRMIGLVALGEKKSSEPFTARDRKLLEALATQIGIAYENILLRQGIQDRARAEEAIRVRLGEAKLNLVRECPRCGACFDSDVDLCENDGAKLEFVEPVERVIDGKYRLDSVIGRGGMGSVYRAYHQRLNRMVAVKVLGNRSLNDATALRRFAREAQASARIDHPNVVRVYESGELAAGGAYLVMELIHGYSWRKLLRDRKVLSGPEAAVLVEQLLDGVEAAHQAHVLHRDLKPENVMISEQGNVVKVADFGLAKIRVDGLNDPKSQTRMGIAMGTLGYMSREQMLGRQVDERTDIYSIGMIVLETLTGPLPPSKLEVTNPASELLPQRLEHPQATPAQLRLSFILSKCLDLRPDSRYPSIARLRKDLLDTLRACPTDPQVPVVEETVSLDGTVVNRPTMSFPPEED